MTSRHEDHAFEDRARGDAEPVVGGEQRGAARRALHVREGFDPLRGQEQAHVFAVPRQLHAESIYRAEQFIFRVGKFSRAPSGRLSVWIDVTPARELSDP